MMNEIMKIAAIRAVENELTKAGQDAAMLARLDKLQQREITPSTVLPPMRFLFRMFNQPCFPRGELVAITGKAKSGKTFLSSVLMSLCSLKESLTMQRIEEDPLRLLWIDTEQSEESTQDILVNRLLPMVRKGSPATNAEGEGESADDEMLARSHVFNLRGEFWQDRLPMLETAVRFYKPDLVILDGIRDLVNDINDGVMAQDVIERLMRLASETGCCMVCVLHQNKASEDRNLRGWIGTELMNKAFEVYACEKSAERLFTVEQTATRKFDIIDKLKFTVDEQGIPYVPNADEAVALEKRQGTSAVRPTLNPQYVRNDVRGKMAIDVERLFGDVLEGGKELDSTTLERETMRMAGMVSQGFYRKQRDLAVARGVIVQKRAAGGDGVAYRLGGGQTTKARAAPKTERSEPVMGMLPFEEPGEAPREIPF